MDTDSVSGAGGYRLVGQDRQMSEGERFIHSVQLRRLAPHWPTLCPSSVLSTRDRAVAPVVLARYQYPDIREYPTEL